MRYILTTVGLSSLTNGLKGGFDVKEIYRYSNDIDLPEEFKEAFLREFGKLVKSAENFKEEELMGLSAELNALLRYGLDKNDYNTLLCTDTFLGEKSAELIKDILERKGIFVVLKRVKDLRTDNIENFTISLSDIVMELSEELESFKEKGYKIVFNLTGGFKSINSFLHTMASVYADESVYIFESSNALLKIPRLPLKIDESVIVDNIDVFRKLEIGFFAGDDEVKNIPGTLVMQISGEYTLSPWGEIVWQKVKRDVYSKKLIRPVSGKIEYTNRFRKDFDNLNQKEKREVNDHIDLLERYVLKGVSASSLRYHQIKGKEKKKFSHEFYAFEGDDSRRVYCNERDGKIVLEKIDSHLK